MISNNIVVFSYSVLAEELIQTPEASPELTKRSWFGSLMSTDRDETYTIIVKEKPLASIKADLVQAFLSVSLPYTSTQKGFRSGPIKVDQKFSFSNFGFSISISFEPEFGNPNFDTPEIWVEHEF